ncbi:MAG: AAA family ATPase [Desulfuromonadales bacterium]
MKMPTPDNGLTIVTIEELLEITFPPREEILAPIIMSQSLTMIHAWRGIGKTHVAIGIAHAVATGSRFLKWNAPKPHGVLYLDGEMPGVVLQERLQAVVAASGKDPPPGLFRIATPDLQKNGVMPDLSTPEGQDTVDSMMTAETKLIMTLPH